MTDDRVRAAMAHWAPRFVSTGIPLHDFQEVTSTVNSWDQWCRTWVRAGKAHEELGDESYDAGNLLSAGQHFATAALCYHFGKFLFIEHYDEMRAAHRLAVTTYQKALPHLSPPGVRVAVPYQGGELMGVLRLPHVDVRAPVVIMVPGLDSTKEEMRAYEQNMLDRGMATLSVDGPGQGEAEYEFPMRHDFEIAIGAVIDYLEGIPAVDASRVGVHGISLGGYYVVRAAGFEPRVSACVSISGPYRVLHRWDDRPVMTREAYRVRSHSRTAADARAYLEAFDLEGVASRVTCPLHIVCGTNDRLTPHAGSVRMAEEAQGATTLTVVERGNHVVNNMPYRYRPKVADWLARNLGVDLGIAGKRFDNGPTSTT